jgi:hypothetical protein
MMTRLLIVLCIACFCLVAFADTNPAELKKSKKADVVKIDKVKNESHRAEIRILKDQIADLKSSGGDVSSLLKELRELRGSRPDRSGSPRLDDGGEDCASAYDITSLPFEDNGDNDDMTDDYDSECGATGGADVVYTYTPSTNETINISTCGSDYDTVLDIYDHCPTSGSSTIDCNDDDCGLKSCISDLDVIAGITYYIILDAFDDSEAGSYELYVSQDPLCALGFDGPDHVITGLPFCDEDYSGDYDNNLNFSCVGEGGPEVTYEFTPSSNVTITATTCGSLFDTILEIFEGDPDNENSLGCSDDDGCDDNNESCVSGVYLPGGQTYYIVVGGYAGEAGDYKLAVTEGSDGCYVEDCSPTGSCCYQFGRHCDDDFTLLECDNLGGFWSENGTCDQDCPVGRCCYVDPPRGESLLCDDTFNALLCDLVGGDFLVGATCTSDPCGAPPCEPVPAQLNVNLPQVSLPYYNCLYICPDATTLIGIGPGLGPNEQPVLDIRSGCMPENPGLPVAECDSDCVPAQPGTGTWDYNPDDGIWYYEFSAAPGTGPGCVCLGVERILPVELTSFDAIAGDRSVTLNWQTASETDNDYFDIKRDGSLVGRVQGTNNATGSDYSWTENHLTNGTEYTYAVSSVAVSGATEEIFTISATPTMTAATITEYALHQNYPNPFNPETKISFDMVDNGFVNLSIYNLLGQKVATLVNGSMDAGRHVVSFEANNLPSGLYLYRMETDGFTAQKKMVLMK